ncbi:F-type H+-transporting ATPase subunit delta [Microbacterium sp. cf046]|uniref:F0F1 ATP synthase subunit delta n=1 Tax=Microbacterium sp. cf046 TaxID=1761803 RepID=UPI0008ED082F|nr:F0F1 ATP synthase subunit delta [Microbacterium sp. cf046]SFS00321.1 F-type H+-transporting ATPase subunit delta [Microbacterium sp. cf046]
MGSATTQALAATTAALDAASSVDLDTARELFAAARIVGDSPQLSGALADPAAAPAARSRVVSDVFGAAFGKTTLSLLTTAVEQRWSNESELVDGIEELAVRAAAISAPGVDVDGELFSASRLVAENPEVELALGSRLGDDSAKGALIETLLRGRASEATILIVSSLVQQPRERRVRQLLSNAMDIVADQRGSIVATVVTATPLNAAQSERLSAVLSRRYGKQVGLNAVIDPAVVGGLRVQIADDVIDASVAARLTDLRQRLAG